MGGIQRGMLTRCLEKSYDLMTINRIFIRKMALQFLHYFNFNIYLLANIYQSNCLAILFHLKPVQFIAGYLVTGQ